MKYEKPPLTYQQQIELLKSRGLVFDDESKAESQLSNVGYIYKGTITLTRVVSGNRETFYLFNKGGVDYVAKSKSGPFYRLARRMNINGVDYKY